MFGDIGSAVVRKERELGVEPSPLPFRPKPEDDAARAERKRMPGLNSE